MPRTRRFYYASTVALQAEQINFSEIIPFNAEILQFNIHIGLAFLERVVTLFVESAQGPAFNYTILSWYPRTQITDDLVCSGHGWQLRKGDTLRCTYVNTSDIDTGMQIIIKEGD